MTVRRTLLLVLIAASCMNGDCPQTMPMPGGGGQGTVDQLTGPRLLTRSARNGSAAILTFRRDETLTGDVAPAMVLNGAATDLGLAKGIAANAAGELIVVCDQSNASRNEVTINVYADATRLNGNQAPVRQVTVTGLAAGGVNGVALDTVTDILYVGYTLSGPSRVLAFRETSKASFDGTRTADFEFSPSTAEIVSLFADPDEGLFVGLSGGASFCNNVIGTDPTGDCSGIHVGGSARGMALNSAGAFFVLSSSGNTHRLRRSDDGPVPSGGSASDFDLDIVIVGSLFAHEMAIDGMGNAYISDSDGKMFIYENVFTRSDSGNVAPDRTVEGPTALLGGSLAGSGVLLILD